MSGVYPYRLFERTGVEVEYMLVKRDSLDVAPIADALLEEGGPSGEVVSGPVTWSNELALHVVELKVTVPAPTLEGLDRVFQEQVSKLNARLAQPGARLLPTGMHPWMDPVRELRLWPHDNGPVYAAFDRIFDCRGHGWANLQSVHLNLPFGDDERPEGEFGRLHAALRLLLPIMPALAASSPFMDGRATGVADNRLAVYRTNARRVPSVSGLVVPEPVFTRKDYERVVLGRIYEDLAPMDPGGVLKHEWVNARGCIARFERGTIEVRVLDTQECPLADMAVAAAIVSVLKAIVAETWLDLKRQQGWATEPLAAVLDETIGAGDLAIIKDQEYLRAMGFKPHGHGVTAAELWQHLIETAVERDGGWTGERARWLEPLGIILNEGTLSRRIAQAVGENGDKHRLLAVYRDLADCLAAGRMFRA